MKQLLCLFLFVGMYALTSSWTTPASNVAKKTFLSAAKNLQPSAEPWNVHTTEDVSGIWYNECTSESMSVTATLTWVNTGTINNNKLTSVWNIRVNGTAVGLTTGTRYIIRENNNSTFNESFKNGLMTFPLHDKWRFISQGNAPDVHGEFSWMLVYNAKGEEVVNTFNFGVTCN